GPFPEGSPLCGGPRTASRWWSVPYPFLSSRDLSRATSPGMTTCPIGSPFRSSGDPFCSWATIISYIQTCSTEKHMANKYIALRVNREFGDILSVYFEFIRQNLKKFTNVFLGYNGVFLIALLICSYLMASGFIGMITHGSDTYGMEAGNWGNYGQIWFFIGAVGLYLLVMLVV